MSKNISIEKKPSSKSSHKRSSSHNAHQNGAFPKGIATGRYLQKKLLNNVNANIALGIFAMGLAGATTFLILNKKSKNRTLNKRLFSTYNDIRDDAKEFAHNAYERGKRVYETASDYADNIRDTAHDVVEQPYSGPLLLAGAVGGTILGASLVFLLNKNKKTDRNFLSRAMDAIDSLKGAATTAKENVKSTDWGSIANELIETFSERMHEERSEDEDSPRFDRSKGNAIHNLQNAIDMGISGFRLWQKLKNKRK